MNLQTRIEDEEFTFVTPAQPLEERSIINRASGALLDSLAYVTDNFPRISFAAHMSVAIGLLTVLTMGPAYALDRYNRENDDNVCAIPLGEYQELHQTPAMRALREVATGKTEVDDSESEFVSYCLLRSTTPELRPIDSDF